ncbi:MAG TPA: 50S ribosomal protein L9 [Candidatus Paceibacterota bacterium]
MKVIMLKDVKGVGQRGKIVEVKDGYAYNFLIPHKAAEQATPEKIAAHAAREQQETALYEQQSAVLKMAIQSLNGKTVTLSVRATEKGGLFKSLTTSDVVKSILDQLNIHIPETAVELEKPIKQTGEHDIKIKAAETAASIVLSVQAV